MKNFFTNIIVKSVTLTILPLVYPSLFFYALPLESSERVKDTLIVVSVVLLIIHVIALICYGIHDSKQKKFLKKMQADEDAAPKEIKSVAPLLKQYNKVMRDNADKLYEIIKKEKGHSDIIDWQWMRAEGDEICGALQNDMVQLKGNK